MAVVLALLCAIVYGAADFFGGLASRRAATVTVVVLSQTIGFAALLVILPFLGGQVTAPNLAWGAACGVAGAAAVALLYRGLSIGSMSVVSPTTAVLAAVVPVVYGVVVRAERPSAIAYAGIALALVAVVIVSLAPAPRANRPDGALPAGLAEALGAGMCFGLFFIALAQTGPAAGMVPLVAARATSIALFVAALAASGRLATLRIRLDAVRAIVACGVLDMVANVLYVMAVRSGMIWVVAVISSLYPAATVALAAVVLHERLGRVQWAGVGLALAGVVALSAR
jgi:drug/metabolite transporter (DMT)-like permease